MDYQELKILKDKAVDALSDTSFLRSFYQEAESDYESLWSCEPSFSIIPFELEMSGLTPSKISSKEPKNKKNAANYFVGSGEIVKIEYYNSYGLPSETEKVLTIGKYQFSLKTNKYGESLWLKICEIEGGRVIRACRVDSDTEFWSFRYDWDVTKVSTIFSFSSNSSPGVAVYSEYNTLETLSGLYFLNGDKKTYIYKC